MEMQRSFDTHHHQMVVGKNNYEEVCASPPFSDVNGLQPLDIMFTIVSYMEFLLNIVLRIMSSSSLYIRVIIG